MITALCLVPLKDLQRSTLYLFGGAPASAWPWRKC